MKNTKIYLVLISLSVFVLPVQSENNKMYNKGWIDLNKNGKKDIYEDKSYPVEERIEDLLSGMTLDEKCGQLLTPCGWTMYERKGDKVFVTEEFKKEITVRKIGSLCGVLRADPYTQRTLGDGLNIRLAPRATNMMQRYAIENGRLGIPLILSEEAVHGHMAIGTTVYPTAIGLSSTWNPELIEQMAASIAKEIRLQGGNVGYGPVMDLARDPRWSRTEECFGEDPYLASRFGVSFVRGLQGKDLRSSENVASTIKHLIGHGSPEGGHNTGTAHMGAYELNETHCPPFKAVIQAGALSVMSAYDEVDGMPSSANRKLLTDMLRHEWGFRGFVVSDLLSIRGLMNHGIAADIKTAAYKAIVAGVDSDLGAEDFDKNLAELANDKKLDIEILNEAVRRILRVKFTLGLFDDPFVDEKNTITQADLQKHRMLARKIANESVILLKNENDVLPIDKNIRSIAVIGPNADNVYNMLGDYTAPQYDNGVVTVLDGIKNHLSGKTIVKYAKGCPIRGESEDGFAEALKIAAESEFVVLVMGGSSARDFTSKYENTGAAKISEDITSDMENGEGFDRATLSLMGKQEKLMQEIVRLGKPTVLVLIKGRPLIINWANENIPAILDTWYPGMEGGNAIADCLFGDYNPAGRLSVSVPRSVGQLPVYYDSKPQGNRNKYTDESGEPLFHFGYGLSYSEFDYSDLAISKSEVNGKLSVKVEFSVMNSGKMDGDEVAQLYIRQKEASHTTPRQKLVAFKRINIPAGEQARVIFDLDNSTFELYQGDGKWAVEPGEFKFMIGGSSDKISLEKSINL